MNSDLVALALFRLRYFAGRRRKLIERRQGLVLELAQVEAELPAVTSILRALLADDEPGEGSDGGLPRRPVEGLTEPPASPAAVKTTRTSRLLGRFRRR